MAISFSNMTDDEIGSMVRDRYTRLAAAHDAGLTDTHPRDQWNADSAVLRSARAQDENSGLGPKTIQKRGTPEEENALDDQQPENTGPGGNSKPAQDGRYEVGMDGQPRFYTGGKILVGDAALVARSRQSNPGRVRAMENAIPSLRRLK
jgi:hypothetical protein